MIRTSFFLQRHPKSGIIYFRRAIPKRYQHAFNGKVEIKRSLQTYDKTIALTQSIKLNASLENQFIQLDEESVDKDCFGKMVVDGIEADFGGDMEKEMAAIEKIMELRNRISPKPQATSPSQQGFESKKLVEVCKEFRKEKMLEGSWGRQQTATDHESSHNLLIQYFGNREISTVTLADCRKFKEVLLQLPSNMGKGVYAGKTIKQVLAMKPEKTLAPRTINNGYLQRYSSLFSWAAKQGYCASNPFEGLKLKISRNPLEDKDPFTPQELRTIFNSNQYNLEAFEAPSKFWIPIIALFTGARRQEVSQLRPCDIFQDSDFYGMSIVQSSGPLKKDRLSEHKVPLHPKLIELGFIDFVEQARSAGQERLFPEIYSVKKIKSGEVVGRWFNTTYLKNIGLKDCGKTFHCLRHTFVDALKALNIPEHEVAQLVGHKHGSITFGTYGSATPIKALYGIVKRLEFDILI